MNLVSRNINLLLFLLSNFLIKGIGYITQLLLIVFISVEEIGYVRISFNYLEVFNILLGLGLVTALLQVNSISWIDENEKSDNLLYAITITLVVSVPILFVLIYMASSGHYSSVERVNNIICYVSGVSLLTAINSLLIAHLQSYDRFKTISKIQLQSKIIGFIAFLICSWNWGIDGFIISIYISMIVSLYLNFVGCSDIIYKRTISFHRFKKFFVKNLSISSYSLFSNLLGTTNKYLSMFIIGYYSFDEYIFGYFSIALIIVLALDIITTTTQQFYLPKMVEKSKNMNEWTKFYLGIEYKFIVISIAVFIFLNLFAYICSLVVHINDLIIRYIFLLSLSWLLSSFYSLKGIGLISLGKVKSNFYAQLFITPFYIISSLYLVDLFEVDGVAYSRLLYVILSLLVFMYIFKKNYVQKN
ncbi:oligosaccharide flippase family protein [Photobacterium sp. SP02]|uniref:oligosaccharide flippase family protein n=2 Tax=Pseudomonadota TaxID=1224 RepID=UPI0031454D68